MQPSYEVTIETNSTIKSMQGTLTEALDYLIESFIFTPEFVAISGEVSYKIRSAIITIRSL